MALEWTHQPGGCFSPGSLTARTGAYDLEIVRVTIGGSNVDEYPFSWFVYRDGVEIDGGSERTVAEAKIEAERTAVHL